MVDDTDSRLDYVEENLWSLVLGENIISLADSASGPVYNNTLHVTTSNTSVIFHFNGEFCARNSVPVLSYDLMHWQVLHILACMGP